MDDGTRERPPGKTARNESRRDNIRAGAVSGPWRSAPRTVAAPAPEAREAPPVAAEAASPPPRVAHERAQSGRAVALGIGIGALAAVAIVVAAVLLRPGTPAPEPVPAPVADAPPAAAPEPEPAVAAAPAPRARPAPAAAPAKASADPALAGVSTVRLRVGPGFPADRQAALVAALAKAGLGSVQVEPLPFRIATSRVGYYRHDDLAAATALSRVVAPLLGGGEIGVRDYGKLLTDPEPGRLDLWIGG